MTDLPDVTPEYVDHVYSVLKTLRVDLDPDPMVFGPSRLNEKVALSREALAACERVFLQVSQDLQICKRASRKINLQIKMETNRLLSEDRMVQMGRSKTDREALVANQLKEQIEEQAELDSSIQELESLMEVIKAKRYDLKDVSGRLKDQIRLCRDDIDLGRVWGRKPAPEQDPNHGDDQDFDKIVAFMEKPKIVEGKDKDAQASADDFLDKFNPTSPPSPDNEESWDDEIEKMFL